MNLRSVAMTSAVLFALALVLPAPAQTVTTPDLKTIAGGKGWTVFNRTVTIQDQDGRTVAEFDGKPGDGMAWFDGAAFTRGEIECDILGRSTPVQGSFVGIAFGVQSAEIFDAVYFRPFNFRSPDPDRRAHSVQYVSHPDWTWGRLRQEKPGQFEKPVEPSIDGDRWFHVRIVVEPPEISVFVNDASDPCLTVEALSGPRTGAVALWVGNNSPGKFANLKIKSAEVGPAKADPSKVTFVGISGFLIETGGKKVLIDGLSNFTSPAIEQRLLAGETPFNGLDLVIATHSHGDHFKAASVVRCLQNHPKAAFVAPTDAADQVSGFPGRVFPVQAAEGKRVLLEVNGIRIQAMPLSHGTPPPGVPGIVNLGYVVTIGRVTFFHSGDIDPSQLTPELLRTLGLPEERIDFAFVPGFFLAMPEPPPFVTKGIRPRVFVAAHLPQAGQEPLDEAAIRRNFPTAVLFKSELDSWTIK